MLETNEALGSTGERKLKKKFSLFLPNLRFIFLSSQGKLFLVLLQGTIYIFSFKKYKIDCTNTLLKLFCYS